tara:strand:+ start:441 stop:590 length:150 start_codon:yes stop_codon:yes gene_type:complete
LVRGIMTPIENIKQIIAHDITSHDQIEEVRKILDLKEIDLNYPNTKGEL